MYAVNAAGGPGERRWERMSPNSRAADPRGAHGHRSARVCVRASFSAVALHHWPLVQLSARGLGRIVKSLSGRAIPQQGRQAVERNLMTAILAADRHYLVRKGLRAVLETHDGWQVVGEAADGYEAVETALRTSPDIAFVDSAMPRMNGFEVTIRIRQQRPKTEICLFTSGDDGDSIIAEALRVGALGIVRKTAPEHELIAAVSALCRHRPYFYGVESDCSLHHYPNRHAGQVSRIELLTPREREIVQLVAEGMSNKQVGRQLDLSVKTVETHRGAAMRKAGLSSTADLVRYAVRHHMVQP
jgi:DNA-binding NarL/FixJ family response regulator